MTEKLLTFIKSLKSDERISSFDEAATKQAIILRLLSLLDWDTFDVDEVYPEYSVGTKRVDYSLRIGGVNEVFLEVKKAGEELENHQEQLLDYSFREGIRLAILTNGVTWWFYLPLHMGTWEQRKFYSIDVFQQDSQDIALKFADFLARENVRKGKAYDNAEAVYKSQQRQKILQETLPKAWNMIISEPDELFVDLINETSERICGYKADDDTIERFLSTYRNQWLISADASIESVPSVPSTQRQITKTRARTSTSKKTRKTGKKISSFYFRGAKYEVHFWRELLLELCKVISIEHGSDFDKVLTMNSYFARDESRFRDPKNVPSTDIFVETNLSANSIVRLCRHLIKLFDYSDDDLKIDLKAE